MSLWIELQVAFEHAYGEPRNDDLIRRIYSYADWCIAAPSGVDASQDPATAVAVVFYEHIPDFPPAREDMPKWFTYQDVAASKSIFARNIGESAFADLLVHMKRNKHRYTARLRDGTIATDR